MSSTIAEIGTVITGVITGVIGWRFKRDLTDRTLLERLRVDNAALRVDTLELVRYAHALALELAAGGLTVKKPPALRSDSEAFANLPQGRA